jgi:hypothetical protein
VAKVVDEEREVRLRKNLPQRTKNLVVNKFRRTTKKKGKKRSMRNFEFFFKI